MGRDVTFTGEWASCERRLVEMCVAAVDEYLDGKPVTQWSFEKTARGYSLTQPSLLVHGARAASLSGLVGTIRVAVEFAAPFKTEGGEQL